VFSEINESTCCFLPGTKVLMSNGIGKNIEDVKVGDIVKSWNEQIDSIENSKVLDLESPIREGYYNLSFDGGELKVTNEHPIYIKNKGWCSIEPEKTKEYHSHLDNVKQIEVGDLLYTNNKQWKNITSFDYVEKQVQTYNLSSIENNHTFFANNILVHNKLPVLDFTEGHQYFIDIDTDIEAGDAVKLDENNKLIKTTEAKDSTCIGIAWEYFEEYVNRKISKINYIQEWDEDDNKLTLEETRKKYINKELTEKAYVDSFGNNKQGDDGVKLYKVASLGDVRDFDKNVNEESNSIEVITDSSLMGFKVCNENGEIKKGDLVCTSNVPGYVMKQSIEYMVVGFEDDKPIYEERQIQCSYTIGKVMEDVEFDEDGKAKDIYGYLYCG
jgi:hypothetical protein